MILQRLIVLIGFLGCIPPLLAQQGATVAILRSFSGPVFLKAPEGGFEIQLKSGKDIPRPLLEGEIIRCGLRGTAHIWIDGDLRTISAQDGPIRIHRDRPLTRAQQEVLDALHQYGYPGASRGVAGPVWWPPQSGSVRVTTATIRWSMHPGRLELTLTRETGEMIWSAHDIDALTGRLAPEQEYAFEQALAAAQNLEKPIKVILTIASGQMQQTVLFWILSGSAQQLLERRLNELDAAEPDTLFRCLGRGEVLIEALAYADASQEFDRAVAIEPNSGSLLQLAIRSAEQTGNLARAQELKRKLESLESPSKAH